jgi:hypothetical protein
MVVVAGDQSWCESPQPLRGDALSRALTTLNAAMDSGTDTPFTGIEKARYN